MKRPNQLITSLTAVLVLSLVACGEDRSGEYLELTQQDRWIEGQMRDIYLWYYDIPGEEDLKYFAEPKDFFSSLLSKNAQNGKGDKYSYIDIENEETEDGGTVTRQVDRESSYGFDFVLYSDPTGKTSNRYARVIFVLPDSPASEGGLKRGDWISGVNKEVLTSSNYGYLYRGEERRFATARLIMNEEDNTYSWTNTDTLTLSASRPVIDNPFYVDTVYTIEGRRIAYLMYNRFSTGPQDLPEEHEYNAQMIDIFSRFQSSGFDDFILDLRYNPGGYLSCARVLATLLAPSEALGKTFCSLQFNNKHLADNDSLTFDTGYTGGVNLNLKRLYVIVSNLTASASEVIIYCLSPYMQSDNLILIGTKTEGKNVASQPVPSPYNFTLHPIVATVLNVKKDPNYYKGIEPTYNLDETKFYEPLYPLGNVRERMLDNTVKLITTGTMPDVKPVNPETRFVPSPLYNSMERKRIPSVWLSPKNKK